MKRIIITEDELNVIKEGRLIDSLPDDIMSSVIRNKTSLGNNPALPDVFDEGFLERIVNKGFSVSKEELLKIGSIDDIEETDERSALNHLIKICQDRERKIRPQLEKICFNCVVNTFNVPETELEMSFSLVDEVDTGRNSIILDPIDGDDELEFADIIDAQSIRAEVYKRRLLDSLIMGASMRFSANIKSYISSIYELDPKLPDLYRKIIALNSYLLYTKEDIGMTEDDKKQIGTVEVTLGNDTKKSRIESQGVIFPVLLSESLRGMMELFIAHGLPNDIQKAKTIIGKSDYLKTEPWDMRIGPELWDILCDNFNDTDESLLPYILYFISKLPVKKFNYFFKEVFAKTRKGRELVEKIIDLAKKRQNEVESDNTEMKPTASKSILSDDIDADEL